MHPIIYPRKREGLGNHSLNSTIFRSVDKVLSLHLTLTSIRKVVYTGIIILNLMPRLDLAAQSARSIMAPTTGGGGRAGAPNLLNAGSASATLTATRAREALQRTDAQMAAMRALQSSARSAMVPTSYNGLHSEGLQPHPTAEWVGARAPVSTVDANGNHHVEIVQESQNAFLYWNNFNVGSKTKLNFNQSKGGSDAGKWIAFNKVMGSIAPSEIHGSITAQGQVYILNQNGILFRNGSQVNTRGLVASSLPINPYFAGDPHQGIEGRGILNNTDYQFLFSALKTDKSSSYSEIFDPGNGTPVPASAVGGVKVEKGAMINAPATAAGTGGRVMLLGPSVINQGTISTPNGQTILAAGLQVGVNSHPSEDPSLRGVDVYIGRVADETGAMRDRDGNKVGTVINGGIIETPRGNAVLAGRDITHSGILESSTSVSQNGRFDLQSAFNAQVSGNKPSAIVTPYFYNSNLIGGTTGNIEIAAGSMMRILPEWSSGEKVAASTLALPSMISMLGQTIRVGENASILAPGAKLPPGAAYDMTKAARLGNDLSSLPSKLDSGINLRAGNWYRPTALTDHSVFLLGSPPDSTVFPGSIILGRGALVSAAGSTGVDVAFEKNFLNLELRGQEMANSPLQRNGPVRGQTITVDARVRGTFRGRDWIGTPLGDARGFANLIERNIGELTVDGGSVSLNSGGNVSMEKGSVLDVSAGWSRYAGGSASTTKLLFQGRPIDISAATPDRIYDGFYSGVTTEASSKWGVTKTYRSPLAADAKRYQADYLQGADGGSISILSPSMSLEGGMNGTSVVGPRQVRDSSLFSRLPTPSALSIDVRNTRWFRNKPEDQGYAINASPYAPLLSFSKPDGSASTGKILLDPSIFSQGGFGSLEIRNHDGDIELSEGVSLSMAPGGVFDLSASTINLLGRVVVPSGTISLTAQNLTYEQLNRSFVDEISVYNGTPGRGSIRIGGAGLISAAGTLTHHLIDADPASIRGGSIALRGWSVSIENGSRLDVSGGAILGGSIISSAIHGDAGSLLIAGGQDPEHPTVHDGQLTLGSSLRGFAGPNAAPGTLSISAPAIQIGGVNANTRVLNLETGFFDRGGFSSFVLNGVGIASADGSAENEIPGIRVTSGSIIRPMVRNRIVTVNGGERSVLLAEGIRPAVSLQFKASGLKDQSIQVVRGKAILEEGALIQLDPQLVTHDAASTAPEIRSGSFVMDGKITRIAGSIIVPGGSVLLSGAPSYPENYPGGTAPSAFPTLSLEPGSIVSTAGRSVVIRDPLGYGRRIGSVVDGGEIALKGNIDLRLGSLLDVSGNSGGIYVRNAAFGIQSPVLSSRASLLPANGSVTSRVDSAGGAITIAGSEMLIARGTLLGRSGGSSAPGGSISISSGRFYPEGQIANPRDENLVVTSRISLLDGVLAAASASGEPARGYFALESMAGGGFDNLRLGGNVSFSGPVSIDMPSLLKVASGGVIKADSTVFLKASHVALGTPLSGPLRAGDPRLNNAFGEGTPYEAPRFGPGSLVVEARSIDLGNLLLRNIGRVVLNADKGGIRGDGSVAMAGDLLLRASRIYPLGASRFTLTAYDTPWHPGSIRVEQNGSSGAIPLSAGGTLSLYSSSIVQNGTLLAPFGRINLGWDGEGVSPVDTITGAGTSNPKTPPVAVLPKASQVTLGAFSRTSVSAIDPATDEGITIPYGLIVNGTQWIDPTGADISRTGPPERGIRMQASSVTTESGSSIDLRGGGDLIAYQWVKGLKGTVDLTAPSEGGYAILPGFDEGVFPINPFADLSKSGGDAGYVHPGLSPGDSITLQGGAGLISGTYTLLPSRYASLPGAYLVRPTGRAREGRPATVAEPDGAIISSGYLHNTLNDSLTAPALTRLFEIISPDVLAQRADYQISRASSFLLSPQASSPVRDAASLVVRAGTSMNLLGSLMGAGSSGGRGADIDLSSRRAFHLGKDPASGSIVLDPGVLTSWKAGSLLIGGERNVTPYGVTIMASTPTVTVDNAGSVLSGADLILVAKGGVFMREGAEISSAGEGVASAATIEGNGALLRVSADSGALVSRIKSDGAHVSGFEIGEGVVLRGGGITLDSSGRAVLDESTILDGRHINLNAGKISVSFDGTEVASALNLTGASLGNFGSAEKLTLRSYSSIGFSGNGTMGGTGLRSLGLNAAELVGNNLAEVKIVSGELSLANSSVAAAPTTVTSGGRLSIDTGLLDIGDGIVNVTGFSDLVINSSLGLMGRGKGGIFSSGNIGISTPFVAGSSSSLTSIESAGSLRISSLPGGVTASPGISSSLRLKAGSISVESPVVMPGGSVVMSTVGSGGISITSTIDVSGRTVGFFDAVKHVSAGAITLSSAGGINLGKTSLLDLSADGSGGDAGTLALLAPQGTALIGGGIRGQAANGKAGLFEADLSSYGSGNLSPLEGLLTASGFTRSRDVRIRNGDVTVAGAKAHSYSLTADSGSITVTGLIDASGVTGGSIALYAGKSVLIKESATLDASGDEFDSAGKGGYVTLEAGNNPSLGSAGIAPTGTSGSFAGDAWVVDLAGGSLIDLTVDEVPGLGQSEGRLHLRAPQTANASDVQVNPIGGEIKGASAIGVEGVFRQDAAFDGIASIDSATPLSFRQKALDNAAAFMANAGVASARILSAIPADKKSLFQINPGEEIMNSKGGLLLNNDWNLSSARYGDSLSVLNNQGNPTGATTRRNAGFLTLRAKDDITFNGSLSDGFGTSVSGLYFAQLLPLVRVGLVGPTLSQSSWSYRIAAGGDFNSADPLALKENGTGSVNVGKPTKNSNAIKPSTSDGNALNSYTPDALAGNYQVIRTGTGDISVAAGGDIRLRNQFATIYTAGARATDPRLGGTFDPRSIDTSRGQTGPFGRYQQPANYAPQYSLGGGNVSLSAGGDIEHVQLAADNSYIPDSSRQLPVNWLSRRGQTDGDGNWMTLFNGVNPEIASTTWWVNFANFFQGVGALGGGNVSMLAGGNVSNVDAVIPTQGRVTARDRSGKLLAPADGVLVETGGGDLTVEAGGNIDAGVYYVERGDATIKAGGDIISNRTRDAEGRYLSSLIETSFANDNSRANPDPESWLPTSFFLGKGNITVTAGGDALLGPVGNVFLLPQGINDGLFAQGGLQVYYRNYFSTYAPESRMSAVSLGGNITFRTQLLDLPAFQKWMVANRTSASVSPSNPGKPGDYQPWLRISEFVADAPDLGSAASLLPASIDLAAVSGSIELQGNLTLSPAARGGLSLLSASSINGVSRQQEGVRWSTSVINISDASPALLPSVRAPLSAALMRKDPDFNYLTSPSVFLREFSYSLQETASYTGANAALQGKIARHDQGLLHAGDADPVRIYALGGDLSGLGVFSPKATRVLAGGDIRDISLSIQHLSSADLSVVSAGGDLRPFDENTPRLEEASKELDRFNQPADWAYRAQPRSGDIQISGPGMLQVLAGRDIDLGTGDVNSDGTGVGITSIGNARNPALPFDGASIIAVAGMSLPSGLGSGDLRSVDLLAYFAPVDASGRYFSQLIPMLNSQGDSLLAARVEGAGSLAGILRLGMDDESMARIALSLFYVVLRDSGRDRNNPASPDYGTYRNGLAAIDRFLPTGSGHGDIILNARDIRTKSGGGIDLVAPRGGISLANYAISESLTPPGIVTESGGGVNIFSRDDVSLGIGRIFTLRGGDVMIWSDKGDIAAGSSAKTVQSAPPTRVLIDPQSGAVETDLAGIATGGGIGVLATVAGVAPSDVDLIAPTGVIDAGDAGIRSTGNLNLAATRILNANNISVGGNTTGAPPAPPPPAAPNVSGATAASSASAGNNSAAQSVKKLPADQPKDESPSVISVEVLGYGGGDSEKDDGPGSAGESVKKEESEQGTKQAAL